MEQFRSTIPSLSALVAFEAVARLETVSLAAQELNTSQSAISRHLKQLDAFLGASLFRKDGRGIRLTSEGETYLGTVLPALERLRAAGSAMRSNVKNVTIACTHEVSHLILMPKFSNLRRSLGSEVDLRVLTCEYEMIPASIDAGADVVFQYANKRPSAEAIEILPEEVSALASPDFRDRYRDQLSHSPDHWQGVPRLALTKNNLGWSTWEQWYEALGLEMPKAAVETFDNYVYLLESAVAGNGIAIGWRRFSDRYLETGSLQNITGEWIRRGPFLYAMPTANGARKNSVTRLLKLLSDFYAD